MFPAWKPDQYADDNTPHTPRTTPASIPEYSEEKEEEEDFQMVSLNDDHWTSEEIPERMLCIHKHGLPHGLCPYPCPYVNYQIPSYIDSLDLSDISDLKIIWLHPVTRTYWHLKIHHIERDSGFI